MKLIICNIYLSNFGSINAVGMYCAGGGKSGEMEEHRPVGPDEREATRLLGVLEKSAFKQQTDRTDSEL